MPWTPLPRIAFAIATHPFNPTTKHDLPLELGDELYIIESCNNGEWFRGYLVAPPSVLSGLTSRKGQTLEARVFSGIFPSACVRIREVLGPEIPIYDDDDEIDLEDDDDEDLDDDLDIASPVEGGKDGIAVDVHVRDDSGDDDDDDDDDNSMAGECGLEPGTTALHQLDDDVDRDTETEASYSIANGGLHHPPRHHQHPPPPKPTAHKLPRSASKTSKNSAIKRMRRRTPRARPHDREKPPAPVPMLKVGDETATHESEPLVDEIASCLREWHSSNLHELLLSRQYGLLSSLSTLVQQLDLARRQLLHNVLTRTELYHTREKTVWELVRGNKLLSREIIVREPNTGRILTGDDSAIVITTLQTQMSLLDAPPVERHDGVTLHHLLLDLKAFVGVTPDSTTLVFYLANRQNQALSECFSVDLSPQGVPIDVSQFGRIQTLFTDLTARDISDEIYLVARVLTNQTVNAPGQVSNIGVGGHSYYTMPSNAGTTGSHSSHSSPTIPTTGTINKNRMSNIFSTSPRVGPQKQMHTAHSFPTTNNSAPKLPPDSSRTVSARRSLGVGVIDVTRFLRQEAGAEHVMRVFVPLGLGHTHNQQYGTMRGHNTDTTGQGIGDWEGLVKDIIDSRTDRFEKSPKADRIHIFLRPFTSPDAESLIKSTPTLLHNVVSTQKIGFSGAPTKPRSDIYLTIGAPMIPRHAVLLHPKTGSSTMPIVSNLQLAVEMRTSKGDSISEGIYYASNHSGKTTWNSSLINRDEGWHETIKLVVPEDIVHDAHVFITLSFGAGTHPIALGWMPLSTNGTFIRDGEHLLTLYRHDDYTSNAMAAESGYLSLAWQTSQSTAASISVKSFLCSTQFSQDTTLLGLLRWRDESDESMISILKKFGYIPEMEVVKLLKDVFDALFGLLVQKAGQDEFEDLVFYALVTVLNIVYDRRFHLEPIVDDYASQHFNYPFATACLIRSFTRLLSNPTDPETSKHLRATFKVGRHMLRFITYAREQQKEKEADIGITNSTMLFTKDLRGIFKLLEQLMRNTSPILVGSQTLAVQHFHTWMPELGGLLSTDDILLIAIDFMDACDGVKGKLVLFKLILIVNYSRSQLFSNPDARRALALNTVRWIEPCWGKTEEVTSQYREQVRLCCSVLSTQIDEVAEEVSEYVPKIIDSYLAIISTGVHSKDTFSLLFPKTYPFPTRTVKPAVFDEVLLELSAILAAMSTVPTVLNLDFNEVELAEFLMNALNVHTSILSCEAFPNTWLSVHIYQHKATMRSLEMIAGILGDTFLPDPDDAEKFNMDLWLAFFTTLLKLVGSDALALETFPEQKRRAVWKVGGDVREQGAELLRRTWEAIGWDTSQEERQKYGLEKMGGYQVQYVPGLVAPIVELCLCVHEGLRVMAVEVLQSMIISEWTLSQDLSVIQAEMIDSLDRLFKAKHLSESITQKLFIIDLSNLFEPLAAFPDDPLHQKTKELLSTIDNFLDLLVAVHNTPLGEAYHIMDTLRLMDFLKDVKKEDMFIRYVHQLVTIQALAGNHIEAGLSLQLHVDMYVWDPDTTVPLLIDPLLPEQTMFERREALCLQMISHFEEGHSWENSLEVYKELSVQYEHVLYDYSKLSKAHRAIAKLYENILRGERAVATYYKVAYFGMGFPQGLRDKQFIIQGNAHENLLAFTDKMKGQHPQAKVVGAGDVDNVEGQFLQILEVIPELDLLHPVNLRGRAAANVRDYLQTSRPRLFAVPREEAPGEWTEKIVYETSDQFPTILRRSEVINAIAVKISPCQGAVEVLASKTQELNNLERELQRMETRGELGREFTEFLQRAVEGSIDKYRLEGEEVETQALQIALGDYVNVLKRCLAMHGRLLHGMGGQEGLMRAFERNFGPELTTLTPLAPLEPVHSPSDLQTTSYFPPTLHHQQPPTSPPQSSPPPSMMTRPESHTGTRRERLSLIFSNSTSDVNVNEPSTPHSRSRSRSHSKGRTGSVGGSSQASSKVDHGPVPPMPTMNVERGGSVRRRLSLLKLGKKSSKSNVRNGGMSEVGSVIEE